MIGGMSASLGAGAIVVVVSAFGVAPFVTRRSKG
jgi:hypothetical protein